MKKLSLSVGALIVAIALLAGVAFYYASAQNPTTPSQPRPPSITGSVKAPSRAAVLAGLAKLDLLKAIEIAKGQQAGTVIGAHLGERNSYVVYNVVILTADGSSVLVVIDAGNGNVLAVIKLPDRGFGRFGHFGPGKRGGF
ncbi:MAG: PepSY domain-containing protein [Candidatus Bipolaricaulota bacterium]|nr:PepSY domain-containing protein [Candidatus Bipolaricaulota bacterium]